MTCREFVEFLDAYLGGTLAAAERASFEKHLRRCRACVRYLETYRAAVDLGVRALAPRSEVPEEVPEDLVRAILAARGT